MARDPIHPGEHLADMWLNLQKLYELRVAERKAGGEIDGLPVLDRSQWELAEG